MRETKLLAVLAVVGLGCVSLLLGSKAAPSRSADPQGDPVARGEYLVKYGGCADCHTPRIPGPNGPDPDPARHLAGHPQDTHLPDPPDLPLDSWSVATANLTAWSGPWGVSYASNLTPDVNTGMGIWTEDMFISAMRTGRHFGVSRPILPPMPWRSLAGLTDADLKAIFAYLRSIPPVENRVPEPVPPQGAEPAAGR